MQAGSSGAMNHAAAVVARQTTSLMRTIACHRLGPRSVACIMLAVVASCAAPGDVAESRPSTVAPSPSTRLHFETVRSILHDRKGNYWFGSWNQGVCRFDGTRLTYFTTKDGLSSDQIRSIHEDRDGVVWFEGGVGLSGFDGAKVVAAGKRDYTSEENWTLGDGDLWFKGDAEVGATAEEGRPGVYRYDGATFTYHAYPLPVDVATNAYSTTGFARGRGGRVWFATYCAVFGYDGRAFTVLDDERLSRSDATGRLHARCVFEDRVGNLWIGNNGIGVLRYDGRNVVDFTQQQGLGRPGQHAGRTASLPGDVVGDGPSMHRVFSIGEDRDGGLWFGTVDSGAWRYDGKVMRNFASADGLDTKDVFCIYTDRRGDLWLAGHGVFRWNGRAFERVF